MRKKFNKEKMSMLENFEKREQELKSELENEMNYLGRQKSALNVRNYNLRMLEK